MSFANVNIGTIPGDGGGDPLRSAFNKINQNFANIDVGNITVNVTAPVQSVAGRTGNVVLTVNDIPGAASEGYVDSSILVSLGTARNYTDLKVSTTIASTMANLVAAAPGTLDTLNELAAALGDDANFSTTVLDRLAGIDANISTLANLSTANLSFITNNLSANIASETARAVAAESALGALIANAESNISLTNSNLSGDLAAVESSLINLVSNTDSNLASINASLSSAISNVNANVSTLSGDLATESNARATADTTLQNNINAEANVRATADTTLQNNIDGVSSSLTSLIANAESNISTVSTSLSNEITRATQAESALGNLIANAESNISSVSSSLTSLIANAESNISTVSTSLTSLIANAESNASTVSTSLSNEVTRATQAEADLASNIALKADITYVDSAVSNLVGAAPTTLDTLNEIATALGNDANLSATLTSLIGNVESNVSNVSTALGSEVTRATQAEADLASNIALKANTADLNTSNWDTAYGWGDHAGAGYLTAYTETNDLTTAVVWDTVPDAYVSVSSVTQHQANITITESQISDLQNYLTSVSFADIQSTPTTLAGYGITDAVSTGDFTFSNNTLGVSSTDGGITINANGLGEIVMSDNVGIRNDNPGYMLHVGKQTDIGQTGSIGISYGNVEVLSGNIFAGTAYLMGGEVSLTWDWSDGQGAGSNPGANHGRFGIFKNGSLNDPWLTFDRDAPADVLAVDSQGRLIVTNGSGINTTAAGTTYSDNNFKVFDPWGPLFVTNRNLESNESGTTNITDVCHSFHAEANVTENLTRYDRIRGFSSSLDILMNGYQWDAWNKFPTVAGAATSVNVIGSGTISQVIGGSSFSIVNATSGSLNVADTANDDDSGVGEDLGVSIGIMGGSQLIVTDTSGSASTVDVAAGLSTAVLVDNSTVGAGAATITNAVGLYLPYRVSESNSWARTLGSATITNRFSIHSEDPNAVLRNYGNIETNGAIKFTNGAVLFKVVSAPTTSIGQAGDVAGMTANDANYHYYCTADFDGTTDIWKRVSWSADTW